MIAIIASNEERAVAIGFKVNYHDTCVLNRDVYGKQVTVGIHVDDMVITA
jgi:hypothetical protein